MSHFLIILISPGSEIRSEEYTPPYATPKDPLCIALRFTTFRFSFYIHSVQYKYKSPWIIYSNIDTFIYSRTYILSIIL